MKRIIYLFVTTAAAALFTSCSKLIDIDPISNVGVDAFYRNYNEVNTALTGCYNGLQGPLYNEWMLTELRGTNSLQGVPNSSATQNIELNDLDMYTLNASHDEVYNYWIATYKNIRALNYVLKSLGAVYENGAVALNDGTAKMDAAQKNQLAGEALFLRAYHYFNLVRLYGGVFLITDPVVPQEAKKTGRSTVEELYRFITADLTKAVELLPETAYAGQNPADMGRATVWAADALLAKVYLTRGKKAEALLLLNEVIDRSGYGLLADFEDVFSIANEMNRELIFSVRYKAGGFGLGSPFANLFAPTGSGNAVVNNDGNGFNFPTFTARGMYRYPASANGRDARKDVTLAQYTATKPYVKKFLSQVVARYDAENDFPVIRFSDVLLMKAEALGYDGPGGTAVGLINQVRARAGAGVYSGDGDFGTVFYQYPASGSEAISDAAAFTNALLLERQLEFAYENQQFFDMARLGDPVAILKAHFASEYPVFYVNIRPAVSLADLQSHVTADRMLLPIPQREIDTNDEINIGQNPGY
ncbi:RagB/SusD family nutrient uptake outer membrane protein [Niabella beijingensis]|uniref:RagB/SusD family nutrient uptake outer membrane protein n=1 Tax=Niabella beijingensis TaxID=2872700 RepID=UPI001CBADAFC|nr:RagB/SusD family nutrient uptake outer membrane protein [Niabella beijingensis]MBZ4188726.1 RagB/SusD family nutrient uptake outer membrane protein [Niabella beijingensis]